MIVVAHFLARRVGIPTEYAHRSGSRFNLAVLLAWAVPVAAAMAVYKTQGINSFMLPLPTWLACGLLYIVFTKMLNSRTAAVHA